jgi:hypothetical protein
MVRGVWDDLAPLWSAKHEEMIGADRGLVVVQRFGNLRVLGADGQQLWQTHLTSEHNVAGVACGVVAIAHHEGEFEYAIPSTIDLRDIVTGASVRSVGFDSSLRARAAHPSGALLTYAQRGAQHILMHADAQTDEHILAAPARIFAEHVAIAGAELLLWPADEARPTVMPLQLTMRARASVDGDLVVVRDGRRLIALQVLRV